MTAMTPSLWFDGDLEEAVTLYSSIFPDATTHSMMRGPDGTVFTAEWELAGQRFKGLNGGPQFRFNEAVSITVDCEDQAEVDRYWAALTADGGEAGQCGWLKDKFGLSWQIVPVELLDLVSHGSPEQVGRAMGALRTMQKLDVAALRAAYEG